LHADWKQNGKNVYAISPLLRRSCSGENNNARACSAWRRRRKFTLSVPICTKSGRRRPPQIRDRKELLRTLLEEVIVALNRLERRAHLTLRWRGGALTELDLSLPHSQLHGIRTDEDALSLLRCLAAHYSDDVIAGILNRQGRKTANGERFTANQVGGLRRYRNIPRYEAPAEAPTGELVTLKDAAKILGVAASTIHRWINDGFVAGEQITPGAPGRIRMTDELRARFVEETPPQFLPMLETTMKLGVTRQTVLQHVKRGELEAVHVRCGRRKGLRIKVVDTQPGLFQHSS
jgi:predicted DNA-binding transcriptional regulator AlpA